jgi:hypothetical protein
VAKTVKSVNLFVNAKNAIKSRKCDKNAVKMRKIAKNCKKCKKMEK